MTKKTKADLNDPIAVALAHYEAAAAKLAELDVVVDGMINDKTSDGLKKGVTMDEFHKALSACRRQAMSMFGALDKWQYLVKHKDDPSTEPAIPEADVANVISASLSDKIDELAFTVNYGLLSHKLAHLIRMDVQETDSGDVPLCGDHS